MVDLLLSEQGILGTLSPKNGNADLPNCGWHEDGQPTLYFSNPDLWWASEYHLNRLGQGGFRIALVGVMAGICISKKDWPENGNIVLKQRTFGKPKNETYSFAEKKLEAHRCTLLGSPPTTRNKLSTVYMVGGRNHPKPCSGSSFVHIPNVDRQPRV